MRYRPAKSQDHPGSHEVTAIQKDTGEMAGWLAWEPYGEIHTVEVEKPFQRQGVATAMLRHAENVSLSSKGHIPFPEHSTNLSDEGQAWADKAPNQFKKR